MLKPLAFLLFLLPVSALAQHTIWGTIKNFNNKKPIENANVFISNATNGAKTKADGTFRLDGIKNGRYELVVSMVGYAPFRQPFLVNDSDVTFQNIELVPKIIELNEVNVKPDKNRKRNYDWFKHLFLGNSDNAAECQILNPDIIDLDYDDSTKRLTASSNDFIEIENDALGYKLKYLLNAFLWDTNKNFMSYEGAVWFENLDGTPSQKKRWTKNRQNTYLGSSMHFFRSVIGNQLAEDGFWVHQLIVSPNTDRPADSLIRANMAKYRKLAAAKSKWSDSLFYWVDKSQLPAINRTFIDSSLRLNEIIKITNVKGIYSFGCDGSYLYIVYAKKNKVIHPNYEETNLIDSRATVVSFNSSDTFFVDNGWIINPESAVFTGFWANKRIADLLPVDYEPPAR